MDSQAPQPQRDPESSGYFRTLSGVTRHIRSGNAIRRQDVRWGEAIEVRTKNSLYTLIPMTDGSYLVKGGWFTLSHQTGERVRINGCTWGGHAICRDIVAAPGLFLEFSNSVRTTRIQSVTRLSPQPESPWN